MRIVQFGSFEAVFEANMRRRFSVPERQVMHALLGIRNDRFVRRFSGRADLIVDPIVATAGAGRDRRQDSNGD